MNSKLQRDAVDLILAQWQRERPDLDTRPMGTIGRLKRCSALVQLRLDAVFSALGMTSWEFDVLATLRRSGTPYCLTPTALFSAMMITSGTMTHRLQRLETAGWVSRIQNPDDARSMLVQLSPAGLARIDQALLPHLENEHRLLATITPDDLDLIDTSLAKLLAALEPPQ